MLGGVGGSVGYLFEDDREVDSNIILNLYMYTYTTTITAPFTITTVISSINMTTSTATFSPHFGLSF